MILSDVVAIALSIIGFLLSLQGLWLVCRALWPGAVDRAAARCETNRKSCFFLGLVVTGIVALVAALAGSRLGAPGQLATFVLLFFYIIFSGIGASGLVTHIGRQLESPADAGRSWRATVRGGVVLELAYLIPILGWFGIVGISLIVGAGAATMAVFSRSSRQAAEPMTLNLPPLSSARRSLNLNENKALDPQGVM